MFCFPVCSSLVSPPSCLSMCVGVCFLKRCGAAPVLSHLLPITNQASPCTTAAASACFCCVHLPGRHYPAIPLTCSKPLVSAAPPCHCLPISYRLLTIPRLLHSPGHHLLSGRPAPHHHISAIPPPKILFIIKTTHTFLSWCPCLCLLCGP